MPKVSHRLILLRKLDACIAQLTEFRHRSSIRRQLIYLIAYRRYILSQRYVSRTEYMAVVPVHLPQSSAVLHMAMRTLDHRHAFRMTPREMDRLIDLFGDNEVFQSTGTRPQAPPRVQIGLLVHRLAHGHCTATIARTFGLSRGSVHHYTVRASLAIASKLSQYVSWPAQDRREVIKERILDDHGIPTCLGFIDGVNMNLDRAPSQGPAAGSYHGRKERYGFNLLAVCDHQKRFTFIHWGFSARSSDMRLQSVCGLHTSPERFFAPGEFVLADSGFKCTTNIIPMYKRSAGQLELAGRKVLSLAKTWSTYGLILQAFFNTKASPARVAIEHAFGILKGRWQLLRNAKLRLKNARDEAQAYAMIQSAFVLHNLTISTYDQFLTAADLRELRGLEPTQPINMETDGSSYSNIRPDHLRRERLVDEMMSYETDLHAF